MLTSVATDVYFSYHVRPTLRFDHSKEGLVIDSLLLVRKERLGAFVC